MSENELKAFAKAQLREIQKYRAQLSIQLGRDPLRDRTFNEIAIEWIANNSSRFRSQWEKTVHFV